MRAALSGRAHRVESMASRIEAHARHRIDEFRHLLRDFASRFDRFASGVREKVAACESSARLLKTLDPRRPLEKGYALVWGPDGILKDAASVDAGTMLELQLRRGRLGAKVTEKKT
jgi:exonuclease VII large subunit